jgi:RHH-type proline utilization regulon transcriptional repressor/proline dehydrogenase/delta 1-pyrroline-5-carboxylate dehydrogenase
MDPDAILIDTSAGPLASPGRPVDRTALRALARAPEAQCLAGLLEPAPLGPGQRAEARALAASLVGELRARRTRGSGVDALMREFSLSSNEGVALMCLAEALARIPDRGTADALIRDKLAGGDWSSHLGGSRSLFVNAAAWGLMVTGKLVTTHSEGGLTAAATRIVARGGEPLIRAGVDIAMRLLGQQFVLGRTIELALERARDAQARGYRHSFDMLGEAALTAADASRYFDSYAHAIRAIGADAPEGEGEVHERPGISVKLSALHPRFSFAQRDRAFAELYPRLLELCRMAAKDDLGLNIDAEESERLEITLDLLEMLAHEPSLRGWEGLGTVVQAYQRRGPAIVDWLGELARSARRRLLVRLVKGAYWDSEVKRAQAEGQADFPVWTRKSHTDAAFLACARRLVDLADRLVPQFATHNALSLAGVLGMTREAGVTRFELQCLHGMGESLYDMVVGPQRLGVACRIYAPVGSHETLLAYLVRRLLENGANSSFVNRIVDEAVPLGELLEDPLDACAVRGGTPHPGIRAPARLFAPDRANSAGIDLADVPTLEALRAAFEREAAKARRSEPMVAGVPAFAPRASSGGPAVAQGATAGTVRNPARRSRVIGLVTYATPAQVGDACAAAASSSWGRVPARDRARILEAAADLLEAHRDELAWLAVHEAGKCVPDAFGEVREAADFCRYYARELRAGTREIAATAAGAGGGALGDACSAPLGPVVAISPWNFPLAIFTGQVAAALAAGNPVLAKPAEQTPLIATRAVELLREAGVPPDALQMLPGDGAVGEALVRDPRVRGVLFTGSTEVAQRIDRVLAGRAHEGDAVLVAETGGQNAMIVDSSAQPEQVVQDAVFSAFNSAGQRCSALRLLCLQQEVSGPILEMLLGAMAELRTGNPVRLETDLGPVIDEDARGAIEEYLHGRGPRVIARGAAGALAGEGSFVAPAVVEVDSVGELGREVFGPVLHVLRYRREDLPALVDAINASGYALTCGIHSRIDETISFIADRVRAGNVYVNRNMIGAVVGVQPFGGEGLSGTGPKAGGPWTLPRLRRPTRRPPAPEEGAKATIAGHQEAMPGERGAMPVALAALGSWLRLRGEQDLANRCEANWAASALGAQTELPGPTGESNVLRYRARGRVLCIARAEGGEAPDGLRAAPILQLAACLATGNRALFASDGTAALLAGLPQAVSSEVDWAAGEGAGIGGSFPFEAVLLRAGDEAWAALRRELAARDGARIAIVRAVPRARDDEGPEYDLARLLCEQVISINTAAAGGNASLMTLEPD